jgi:hypothetical protein
VGRLVSLARRRAGQNAENRVAEPRRSLALRSAYFPRFPLDDATDMPVKSASDRVLDSVESALERAREKQDGEEIVRLEMRRDKLQAKAFRALQRRIKKLPK